MNVIEMGLLFGAMAVSYVVTTVPTGQLSDKLVSDITINADYDHS